MSGGSPLEVSLGEQVSQILHELVEAAGLGPGKVLVVGTSTSEVAGKRIGTSGALGVAEELLQAIGEVRAKFGFDTVFQCCEHLNRALVMERSVLERLRLTEVAAVPVPKAGGSMAAAAYRSMKEPCLAEAIEAHAGIDIGETMIGMHLRRVAGGTINMDQLRKKDPAVLEAMNLELKRQRANIELIASENIVSEAVMEAMGSVLTNKYAEGYPGKRYYGGCERVDIVEDIARDRAKELFGAEHANVQPHSGAQANMAVYLAALKPGDTVLGMNLAHGGHLTHGSPVNASGLLYNFVAYGVQEDTFLIDYDEVRKLAFKHRPRLIVAGASAYPRTIDFEALASIANDVGALFMVDMAHIAGLVAAGLHPNPVPHAHFVTTTTHKTLRGPRGGMILCKHPWAAAIDKAVFPGTQGGPLMHVIASKAVALGEALDPSFKTYAENVVKNAKVLAETLISEGLNIVSGGTDNHLMLVDTRSVNITGKDAEKVLDSVGITVNKNAIPFDPTSPFVTSGIRIGTPAATSRGMDEAAMVTIGKIIAMTLKAPKDEAVLSKAAAMVKELTDQYPLYPELNY
ncbi:hypothetical protein BGX30_013388 [Mortierella sp. GBA39]|nr:hypothetical protein BGX30_013388 [Mortierella sp. GBA39]